jgi:GntR family transcriptional regulator, transcriptional repressor for pyruvate dehydrogenase complex
METIKKQNLSEAVAQRILALISSGELNPGDKLPSEAELCRMLGVSRTAVREGVKALAGINILGVFPGRGTFVNENPDVIVSRDALKITLGRETIRSLYEARYVLDVGAARFVTLNVTEEDLTALRKAAKKMERAIDSNPMDVRSAAEADEEFHLAFCRASHNKILENISRPVITHGMVRFWKQLRGPSYEYGRRALEGHREILEAVEKKDVPRVVEAVEKHLRVVFEEIGKD